MWMDLVPHGGAWTVQVRDLRRSAVEVHLPAVRIVRHTAGAAPNRRSTASACHFFALCQLSVISLVRRAQVQSCSGL